MSGTTFQLIYEVVKQIPKGKVATYGQVASLAGNRQIALLESEGVKFDGNRVDLEKYRWNRVTIEMME